MTVSVIWLTLTLQSIKILWRICLKKVLNLTSLMKMRTYDFMPMLAHIQPYLEYADISMANLEVILRFTANTISGYPQFNAPSEIITALKENWY